VAASRPWWKKICVAAIPLALALTMGSPPTTALPAHTAVRLQQTEDTLRQQFHAEQKRAELGQETGAQAMCSLLKATAADSHNAGEFVKLTQALFVHNDWIPNYPGTVVPVIPKTTLVQPGAGDFTGLPTTGWKPKYKDATDGKISDEDQSHHLVAYLSLGYYSGNAASFVGSYYHKFEENQLQNKGDINLGIMAGRYGAALRKAHRQHDVRALVDSMCHELSAAKQVAKPTHWTVPDQK
jgi:hypothetical protein